MSDEGGLTREEREGRDGEVYLEWWRDMRVDVHNKRREEDGEEERGEKEGVGSKEEGGATRED